MMRQRAVWERLVALSMQFDAPWLCIGDFNEILFQQEKIGEPRSRWQIEDSRETLSCCDLTDGFEGSQHIWCNRCQYPETIRSRLDKAYGNTRWHERFSMTCVTHQALPYSNHAMLVIQWGFGGQKRRKKRQF
ncbi:UNVERIFIED_CONTAM: hypothetical protein Sradi_0898500 [Sesamum radiatum]|uniref:Exo_endo_phos domain-containing protein n=1 Tax=Sesamum radiatum TaxID=300843 RepID=A0AAW2V375_SESRA